MVESFFLLSVGASLNIISSTFANNTAGNWGGVMHTYNASVSINSSGFTNNNAAHWGGVIVTSGDGSFSISRSTFVNNSAAQYGGVIYAFLTFRRLLTVLLRTIKLRSLVELFGHRMDCSISTTAV